MPTHTCTLQVIQSTKAAADIHVPLLDNHSTAQWAVDEQLMHTQALHAFLFNALPGQCMPTPDAVATSLMECSICLQLHSLVNAFD